MACSWTAPSSLCSSAGEQRRISASPRSVDRFFGLGELRTRKKSISRFRINATAVLEKENESQRNASSELDKLACPICYRSLIRTGPPGFNLSAIYRSGFMCKSCKKPFSSRNTYLDLTVTSGAKEYNEYKPSRTELFRSPLVSFLYERGWRQNFRQSGFPGLEEEFKMAQEYFKPVAGGLLLDVSCGSGLFSRKFASSGTFAGVIALDFSENMLRQCYDFISKDETLLNAKLALVRADVSRLPFESGSVDAVHAGAALHCWPSPSNAVAEINRVLRSGGVFVATTFLSTGRNSPPLLGSLGRSLESTSGTYSFFKKEEIEDLCRSCGLINFSCKIDRAFIMFSAQKP
ncbi:S-adenosyl-L-methionine-dependent methyltransferases superfamily protein [Wolffia australiana]